MAPHPQYICCSATIGNPGEHTGALIGRNVTIINKDGSGRGPQKFIFWNPPFYVNEAGFNVRRSTFGESLSLFNRFVQYGLQTIAFTRARQAAERMYVASRNGLREKGLAEKISPYRAGYFGKEREEIEKKLSSGVSLCGKWYNPALRPSRNCKRVLLEFCFISCHDRSNE